MHEALNPFKIKGMRQITRRIKVARSLRQSKILELISTREIETQDELVSLLKAANFDITQATISRDIKELGLIKVLGSAGNYKYALVDAGEQGVSNKNINLFKLCVISVKRVGCNCIIKTVKQFASGVCSLIDKLNLIDVMGTSFGDDCVVIYFDEEFKAESALNTILEMLG